VMALGAKFPDRTNASCTLSNPSPDGRNPCALTVWIIDAGQEHPRFVSGYASPIAAPEFPDFTRRSAFDCVAATPETTLASPEHREGHAPHGRYCPRADHGRIQGIDHTPPSEALAPDRTEPGKSKEPPPGTAPQVPAQSLLPEPDYPARYTPRSLEGPPTRPAKTPARARVTALLLRTESCPKVSKHRIAVQVRAAIHTLPD
jgi:hypothetical protein